MSHEARAVTMTTSKQITLVRKRDDVDESTFAPTVDRARRTASPNTATASSKSRSTSCRPISSSSRRSACGCARSNGTDSSTRGSTHRTRRRGRGAIHIPSKPLTDHLLTIAADSTGWWVDENDAWTYDRDWPDGVATPGDQADVAGRPPARHHLRRIRRSLSQPRQRREGCITSAAGSTCRTSSPSPAARDRLRLIDGISELWFRSVDDMIERFYTAPGSPDAVREDTTGFIDFANTRLVSHDRDDRLLAMMRSR